MRDVRARLTATERGALAASFVGYAFLGLGIVLLLTSSTPVAITCLVLGVIVLWFAGVWVLPLSRDAYFRRVERILADWTGEAPETTEEIEVYGRWTLERLEGARAPSPERSNHDGLAQALSGYLDALNGSDEEVVLERHAALDRELGALEERRVAAWGG